MVKGKSDVPHTALYRKYRSRSLDEVVGQSQVTDILRRSLKQGKIAHAYLLTGPRGVGKTSIARILAHEINNLPYDGEHTHLDIIEIDAASNNGVDDVRDLRDKVQLAPTSAAKKVYIIDEVHMLSKPAFNALLKTLEEPPAHVVFILATTDLHKVPATIISRTQHFAFHTVSPANVIAHLKHIATTEGITVSDEALAAIAARGEGSFRDSISLLDQLSGFADDKQGITLELVEATLGLAPHDAVESLLALVSDRDVAGIIGKLDTLEMQGIQPVVLSSQLIQAVRQLLPEHPQLINLMDGLLSVAQSSQPQLKLLTVLVGAIKPKTAAAHASKAPSVVIEAPLPKIAEPKKTPTPTPVAKPAAEVAVDEETPAPVAKPKTVKKSSKSVDFNWTALIDYMKEHSVAVYSVLAKCEYHFDGSTLTIYAGRKFSKTKLDDPRYAVKLHGALQDIHADGIEVITVAETKPPEDENLAKVTAIMGGGKQVSVGEEDK